MASLAEILKDKKSFPDEMKFALGNGVDMTLGELRSYQDASGQDVARAIEVERAKLAEEQKVLAAAQQEVVDIWTKLEAQRNQLATTPTSPTTPTDWTTDPFFQPVAKYLKEGPEAQIHKLNEQVANFQKALGLGVKYIADVISEQRYSLLPEDFRKEVGYDIAVKQAAEKKFVDQGGVPDVRKIYDEWKTPRQRKAEEERIRADAYEKARTDLMSSSLARPSGVPVGAPPVADPNAPKTLRESFQRLKEDPEFLRTIYSLTGSNSGQA